MNKKVLIGIIVAILAIIAVVAGIIIISHHNTKNNALSAMNGNENDNMLVGENEQKENEEDDQIDKTLERLGINYIDLLLLHQPSGNYMYAYKLMEKAVKEGKVKAIGLSNFNETQIQEILDNCEIKPTVLQTEVHPYYPQTEIKKFLAKNDIKIQAWYPLGHGDSNLINEPIFTKLAEKYGKSNVQIILRWHIQENNIVIPGARLEEHIKANIDIFNFELTEDEMKQIAAINKNKRYYEGTPEKVASYAQMKPDLDGQK